MNEIELSVVAPCYNEEGNIHLLVSRTLNVFSKLGIRGEIVLIDDCSTDNTRLEIEKAMKNSSQVVGQFHPQNKGIIEGWKTGERAAQGRYIVTIDADLQYRPEDIIPLYRAMQEENYDLVQGWRQEYVEGSLKRTVLSRGFSRILNWLFGMNLDDIKSGFVLYTRECFRDVLSFRMNYIFFQHFITISAYYKGYRIKQLPVIFDKRHAGNSFITHPLIFSIQALWDLPFALWEYRVVEQRKLKLRK